MTIYDDLFDGVGNSVAVDHVAIHVAFGMLIAATTLFKKLGYTVHPTRKASGDWGKAIFMVKDGSVSIQLTDSANETVIPMNENHFGLTVDEPLTVASAIQEWARRGGVEAEFESVPGGKYFVTIPRILTMPIELVPQPEKQ